MSVVVWPPPESDAVSSDRGAGSPASTGRPSMVHPPGQYRFSISPTKQDRFNALRRGARPALASILPPKAEPRRATEPTPLPHRGPICVVGTASNTIAARPAKARTNTVGHSPRHSPLSGVVSKLPPLLINKSLQKTPMQWRSVSSPAAVSIDKAPTSNEPGGGVPKAAKVFGLATRVNHVSLYGRNLRNLSKMTRRRSAVINGLDLGEARRVASVEFEEDDKLTTAALRGLTVSDIHEYTVFLEGTEHLDGIGEYDPVPLMDLEAQPEAQDEPVVETTAPDITKKNHSPAQVTKPQPAETKAAAARARRMRVMEKQVMYSTFVALSALGGERIPGMRLPGAPSALHKGGKVGGNIDTSLGQAAPQAGLPDEPAQEEDKLNINSVQDFANVAQRVLVEPRGPGEPEYSFLPAAVERHVAAVNSLINIISTVNTAPAFRRWFGTVVRKAEPSASPEVRPILQTLLNYIASLEKGAPPKLDIKKSVQMLEEGQLLAATIAFSGSSTTGLGIRTSDGDTLLHHAIETGNITMLHYMTSIHCNPFSHDHNGANTLERAVFHGSDEMSRILLERFPKLALTRTSGPTGRIPMEDYASELGHEKIACRIRYAATLLRHSGHLSARGHRSRGFTM